MSDHDTADRALVELLLEMHDSDLDAAHDGACVKAAASLARRIAEGERLREAAQEFLLHHQMDCGAHFCRYCSARSPEWEHAEHCSFAMSQEAYTKLRAALAAEKSPRRSLNGEPEIEFRTLPIIKKEPPR